MLQYTAVAVSSVEVITGIIVHHCHRQIKEIAVSFVLCVVIKDLDFPLRAKSCVAKTH